MSTIQVRNINFEPTGNNRITYESSNGYFAIVLGGNRVIDYQSSNINLFTSGYSVNTVTSNIVTSNTLTSINISASGTVTSNTVRAVNLDVINSISINNRVVISNTGLTDLPAPGNTGNILVSNGSSWISTRSTQSVSSGKIFFFSSFS